MAKYEQKTDSQEFEVANPDQQRGTGAGEPRPEATELAIRLWSANGDRRVPPTWKTDSVLVYMIADLVVASRGCLAESPTVMAANFEGIGQALVAAKRIQTAILEFVACSPSGPVGAAILVYQPQASDPRGFTGEMVRLALGQAKPGQILLCESVSQRLSNLPGIELRAIPELASVTADGDNGLTELVWTTPERVALLQDAVGAGAEPQDEDSSPVGATMIVHLPFAQRTFPNDAVPPVMAAEDRVFEDEPEPLSQRIDAARDREDAPASEVAEDNFGGSLTEELDQLKNRALVTRTRVIVGIVAVVLAAALVAVIYRPKTVSNVPVPPQQDQNRSQEIPVKAPPSAPGPKIKAAQSDPTPIKPQVKVPPAIVQPRTPVKATVDDRVNGGKENLEVPAASYEYGGFSQKDIPKLLEFARSDAGKGNYVSARKEYSTILQLQPNNQAARDGLHKLDLIQQNQ